MNDKTFKIAFFVLIVYAIIVSSVKVNTFLLNQALQDRERLMLMKQRTEAMVSKADDRQTRQAFRSLGYTIKEPPINLDNVLKQSEKKK